VPEEFFSVREALPPPVEELVASLRSPFTQIEFLSVLVDGGVLEPVLVDAEVAARMAHPYAWLVDRVGTEGIKLTSAGYLPPADVEALAAVLDIAEEWPGALNRESQTIPVLEFRESAALLDLVRTSQGRLLLTRRGRKLVGDPVALWWHLARAMPRARARRPVRHAAMLLLAVVAAGFVPRWSGGVPDRAEDPHEYLAGMMWEAGWARPDGTELEAWEARLAAEETYVALVRMGALTRGRRFTDPDRPTPDGAVFARAALRTWPPATG
jgi:hypothetical protein